MLLMLSVLVLIWRGLRLTPSSLERSSLYDEKEIDVEGLVSTEVSVSMGSSYGSWDDMVSWRKPDYCQSYYLQRTESATSTDVVVIDRELNASTGEWATTAYLADCTFNVHCMASGGRDYFALAGVDEATGDVVVERWRLASKVVMLGAPIEKTFKRTQVYRGALQSPPIEIGVDPDRRFLLLLSGTSSSCSLYQVPLVANATPVVVHDSNSQPVLGQAWSLTPLQHADLGRIWLVSGMTSTYRGDTLVLIDLANDGQFDSSPIVGSQESLEASGMFDPSVILDNFMGD